MISVNMVQFLYCCVIDKVFSLLLDRERSGKDEGPVGAKMELGAVGST